MVIAHFGIAVALARHGGERGVHAASAWRVAKPGDMLSVGPWQVQLSDVTPTAGKNFTALEAELRATRGDGIDHAQARRRDYLQRPADRDQ